MKKTALITGVSKNIGRSICKKFYDQGYSVIGTYKSFFDDKEELAKFQDEFPEVVLYKVDLSDAKDVTRFINDMKTNTFDVVVNNAGMFNMMSDGTVRNEFLDFDLEAFTKLVNCDFISIARICIELKDCINIGGSIVNIASGAWMSGAFASISYNAAKAALVNLTQSLSNNFYYYNKIRVNSVSPGWVNGNGGNMNTIESDPFMMKVARVTPMGRNASTDEIANVVFFLTTKEASFITGADISVDGGYSNFDVIYYEEAFKQSLLKD